jgi:hypothetical protein
MQWVTATDVVNSFPVSRTTLRRLVQEKKFPAPQRHSPNGKRFWSMDEVVAYFQNLKQAQEIAPTS